INKLSKVSVNKGASVIRFTKSCITQAAMGEQFRAAFAQATPFLEVMGDVVMAWMLLWRAVAARPGLKKILGDRTGEDRRRECERNRKAAYYEGQMHSARYFINTLLPVTLGKMDSIRALDHAVVELPEAGFGS
nr:acyl-CoA dehydrogenase C-terminal domain-containing protein [Desulfobacterales bacterium]